MVRIQVRKEPDGWRAIIRNGHQVVVLQDVYDDEAEAILAAASTV